MKISRKIFDIFSKFNLLNILPSKWYLKLKYRIYLGEKLNLRNPRKFNEKLQWLKLYDRKPEYTNLVDKYEVKKIVRDLIGEKYLIKTLGIYNKYEEIDFEKLPNKFVIKCTHDSGGIVICKDKSKFDHVKSKEKLEKSLRKNYYWRSREWPYKKVLPRIIVEEYMEDDKTLQLRDYKFFCFNGEPKCFKIDFDRFVNHRANYYDINKQLLKIGELSFPPDFERNLEMPQKFNEMLDLAKKLSKDMVFVRVDFYEVNGSIYFGEITFFPASGTSRFINEYTNELFGKWLELPIKKK